MDKKLDQKEIEKAEQLIDVSYHKPIISDSFRKTLKSKVAAQQTQSLEVSQPSSRNGSWSLRFAGALLVLLCISVFIWNPTGVMAQIAKWLGYSSTTGLVSDLNSVMTLSEPVQMELDNLTVLVPSASYSKDRTNVDYFVFSNLEEPPVSSGPCEGKRYLTVPGSSERYEELLIGQFPVLPVGTEEVVLNLPCLKTTTNSKSEILRIPLHFQISDEKLITEENEFSQQVAEDGSSGTVRITQSFKEDDSLILVSELSLDFQSCNYFHIAGVPIIKDADGNLLAYESTDSNQSKEGSENTPLQANFKFSDLGVKFPVTISVPMRITQNPTEDLYEGEQEHWSVVWNPSNQNDANIETACITSENISSISKALSVETADYLVEDSDGTWKLVSKENQSILIAEDAFYVSVSANREYAGIIDEQGLTIRIIESGKESKYSEKFSSKAIWNGESNRIVVQSGNTLFVFSKEAKLIKSIQTPQGSLLAGWGSNSDSLLFGTQDIYGQGYILRSVSLDNGEIRNVFYLDKSAAKNINLQISSDGSWVAYRGAQQATLMMKNLNTGEVKTLIDAEMTLIDPTAIDNFFWSSDSLGMVVEIQQPGQQEFSNYLIDSETCRINRLVEGSGKFREVLIEENNLH